MPDEFGGIEVEEPNTDEFGGVAIEEAPAPLRSVTPTEFEANINAYERARRVLPPGTRMTPFGPENPQEVLAIPQILKVPEAVVGKIREVTPPALRPLVSSGLEPADVAVSYALRKSGVDPRSTPEQLFHIPRPPAAAFPSLPGLPPPEVASGLERLGASTVEGLGGRLENIALLIGTGGESAVSKAAALIFASQQFADLPEQVQNAVTVLKDPQASKADKIEAAGQPMVSGLITAGLIRSGMRESPARTVRPPQTPFIPEARPVGIPVRRMVVPPPGMATLEQAEAFRQAGQPIRRPIEEVRVPPEAPQGQPTFAPSGLGRLEPPAFTPALEVPPTPPGQRPIGGIRMPPPPEEPPTPAPEPAPLPPKPPAAGPEIAFTPEKSGGKDLLGNPLGTKYYSTPEDWAAWKKIQADKAIARELGQPAALALGFAKNEALKNGKYGGSVPLPPKGTTDPLITMYHGEGGVGGAGTDTRFFTRDPQQAARYGPNITQVEIPESEVEAFEAARQAKGIGTPGAILTQEYVKRATPMANPPAAPVTEIEAPAAAPAKLVAAAYMPEGATVPETGPHHPGILKRLGIKGFETPESRNTPQFGFVDANGVFHTREESAEIAKATGQDLKEFEEGEPAHSDEIESPTQPGVPISETKPPVPETKAAVPETKPAPAITPEAASEKAQTEVAKVASTEGQRPAKEVKSELVSRLESAVESAKEDPEEVAKARAELNTALEKGSRGIDLKRKALGEALSKSGVGKVTIDIPGDGVFTVWNVKDALQEVLDRARRISTTKGEPVKVSKAGISKGDKEAIQAAVQGKSSPGLIAGTDVETWADGVIKKSGERLRSGLDPELAAAGVVKGVAFLERGITEFAKWSTEMIKAFGEAIRPHLANLYEQAKEARASAFRQSPAEPARKAEAPSLPKGPQPPPSPPASPVQPEAAAAPQGEPTHGIAARVTAAAAQQGIIAPVEPGEGIAAAESVEHGRQLLNQGANPQAVLDEFNRTKSVSADGMAVVRAHGERLRKAARDAANKFGITSDQYDAAWKADSDWTKAIKPMQTEWHKIGQAQQGEVEIDTGTFHGLRSAFFEATGRDFTPTQKEAAEKIAKGVKEAQDAADKAKDDAFKQIDKEAPKVEAQPIPKPARKPGAKRPPVAQPTTKQVWNRAKVIIDGGETDFDDVRHKLAIEFGLPVDEITRILAEPKAVRTVTDDMYRKMAERRRLVQQAKNWLKDQQVPGWYRFIRNIPRVFFIDKVFGHGTVGMITHGGLNIFNPPAWKTYWPNFLRQYKLMVDPGYHERMMQDLVRDPLFTRARRAGLANDPFRYQDDYQTPGMGAWLGKLGLAGNRGFDSLKLFRQARFNQIWNDLPPALRNPVHAKLVADAVNHATGVVKTSFGGEWANWTFFAPKLEGSRWAWMIGDPLKASTTFLDWGNASPEAREAAMAQLKEKAYIAGTYFGLLALNQGILAASGSKDQVNFTNPRRSDFLSFKAEGHNIGIVGPMLGMVRLFANMLHASMGKRGKLESLQSRADEMGATVADYARGKLSPFAGFGVDLATQSDFQGRPLPFSSDRVPAYLRKQGIKKYTYGEYAAQEFTPIPVSEAVREVWRAQGMNESEINRYLDALLVGVVAGGTGARISVATPQKKALP